MVIKVEVSLVYQIKNMKKLQNELQELINNYGYWSKEVLEFNTKLPYDKMCKLNNSVTKYPKN